MFAKKFDGERRDADMDIPKWDNGREFGRVGGKYDDGYGCTGCKYYRPVPEKFSDHGGVKWICCYGGYGCIYK